MARSRRGEHHPDRFLYIRDNKYQYRRRVPSELAYLDERAPQIRISLRTADLAKARAMRDIYERADNELWAALLSEQAGDPWERHSATQRLARARGFAYLPVQDVSELPLRSIVDRVNETGQGALQKPVVEALLGAATPPAVTIRKAFDIYVETIAAHEIKGKSAAQKDRWIKGKKQSVLHFIEVVGNRAISEISRADAQQYYDYWVERIAPREGAATHTADIGNRRMGDLKGLYAAYFTYLNEPDRQNPFNKLRFKRKGMKRRKRPSFSHEWIVDKLLKPGALDGMNKEARAIFLIAADIGARPSEVANLVPERIVLNHEVPHLKIEPDEDPEDPREIKTETSIRTVPVVGLAHEVLKKFPNGFTRYRDRGNSLSATVSKFLRENGLRETPRHTFYSLRHSFEDRMKEAKVDAELRRILMGHALDRPEYGEGGSLKLRQEAMLAVTLPFDPAIVPDAA